MGKYNEVVTILKYNKTTIYHAIYINVLYGGTISCLTVSTNYIINNTNNKTDFPYLIKVFQESFEIKIQEGSVLK